MLKKCFLSLFDGMSCLQIALKELGITPTIYYASEIDKHAIKQTQLNFPNTIQLGDITKWRTWDINWANIDFIGAGSPCQGFSFAGKQLAFDDPRSKLFFEFVNILNHVKKLNPDVKFLLENVNMKKEHMRVINEFLGIEPVRINSNLVSAQNRDRWYWSNIRTKQSGLFGELYTDIPQPKDQGIYLKDILEYDVDEKYYLSDKMINCLHNHSDKKQNKGCGSKLQPKNKESKGSAITARCFKMGVNDNYISCVAMRGRNPENLSDRRTGSPAEQRLEANTTGKTNCLTSVQKDNLIMTSNYLQITGITHDSDYRFWKEDGKHAACVTRGFEKTGVMAQSGIRRLTPLEVSRLQTVPDWYLWQCSSTQQYKMCGNGWTIEVIKHILSYL